MNLSYLPVLGTETNLTGRMVTANRAQTRQRPARTKKVTSTEKVSRHFLYQSKNLITVSVRSIWIKLDEIFHSNSQIPSMARSCSWIYHTLSIIFSISVKMALSKMFNVFSFCTFLAEIRDLWETNSFKNTKPKTYIET